MTDIRKLEVTGPHILGDGRYAILASMEGVSDEVEIVLDDPAAAVRLMNDAWAVLDIILRISRNSGQSS